MKTYNSKYFIFVTTLLLAASTIIGANDSPQDIINKYRNETSVKRQELLIKSEQLVKKANQNYFSKNYELAKDQYLEAVSILSSAKGGASQDYYKINQLKDALSNVYTSWANEILQKASKNADEGNITMAIELCNKAKEINPKTSKLSQTLIEKFKKLKKYAQYKEMTSEAKIAPDLKEKLYNVDVLYEQGKKLLAKKLYSQAKDKFEELLLLDPYNINAIQYIRMINSRVYETGKLRTQVTSTERQAEIEWEKLSPIMSTTLTGDRVDIADKTAIKKTDELTPIKKKLNEIMIKHIAFEEVPIDTAVLFLKRESQKLDPEGTGINFFLRLGTKKIVEQQKEKNVKEESWDEETIAEGEVEPAEQYLITIVLDNIPMINAIEYICKAAGLKYRINQYAVEIASQDITFEDLQTRIFPVEREVFDHIKSNSSADLKPYFQQRGVNFSEGTTVIYDTKISRLIVRNTQQEIEKIKKLLNKAEETLPQVSIVSKFVEMQQKDFDELGFQWNFARPNEGTEGGGLKWEQQTPINRFANNTSADGGSAYNTPDREFGFSFINGGIQLDATLHALNQNTKVEVLSAPRITTLSGHKATIRLIEDRYFPTEWTEPELTTTLGGTSETRLTIPAVPTLQYDEPTPVGVILEVTPYVSSDQYTVDLELEPQVQSFVGWTDYAYTASTDSDIDLYANIKMPEISARTVQTQVRVYDGETVVMGGVYKDDTSEIDDRVPILGDLPLVGRAFRSQIDDVDKTNLLIFTSIKLVKPDGTPLRPYQNRGFPEFRD